MHDRISSKNALQFTSNTVKIAIGKIGKMFLEEFINNKPYIQLKY